MQGIAHHHITASSFSARTACSRARAREAAAVLAVAAAVGSLIAALPAQAQTPASPDASSSPWRIYAGSAHIGFSTSAEVRAGGQIVPGASAKADSNDSIGFGAIYDFHPGWSAELALGLPPTTALKGTGALAGAGTLGKVKYGPAVLSVRRQLWDGGPVRPYIGAGINYTLVLESRDGFVSDLHVKNGIGPVLQAGFEVPLDVRWSFFVDAKKIWLKTTATGTLPALGGAPAHAKVRLDPLVVTAGVSYRF
ncbi:OmpW family outer membrane protein [Acidovorax sp. SUPP2825]|uniref:OmpW/AlkL family protein n=1 Tax=Acidovorax sp. SUPP2825 TaxID=2920879 RepID=UPI0023DE1C45|nr:OmpW family outer membrane protein [Acidovorax sp. SUPP2825]GKS93784.1 OmpW family protein [Acidovorax sp. SUPP2825]